VSGSRSSLTDRMDGSVCRHVSDPFNDVFGEENPFVFFFAANRVVIDSVDNISWVQGCSVREPKDVYKFVSEYFRVDR
jgi:hypothetical protein